MSQSSQLRPVAKQPTSAMTLAQNLSWRRVPMPVQKWVVTALTLGILFALWYWVSNSGLVPAYFVPTPQQTWVTFLKTFSSGYRGSTLAEHLGASLMRVGVAFVAGALVGVPLGLAIGSNAWI